MGQTAADGGRPLTVLTVITPARYSGAERMAVYLADGLQQRGHRVVFATKPNDRLLAALRERNIEGRALPISGKFNMASPFILAWEAARIGADLIHTHLSTAAWLGAWAAKIVGIPSIASVHALNAKACFGLADMLAACSRGVAEHLIAQGVSPSVIRILYNGVYPEQFEGLPGRAQMRAALDLPPDAPVIGEVAHLSPRKGQRYLVEATALLRRRWPDLVCLLVGEGAERAALERRVRELGLEDAVRLTGYRPDAPAVMQAMDVVVLPSVAIEGLGVALIEAAFLGKPVVGSDAPGIREVMVDGETGLLAPPGDAQGLAASIEKLLSDRELARRMGEAGRERARNLFTVDRMAVEAEALYRELLDDSSVRRDRS